MNKKLSPYFEEKDFTLYYGDSFEILRKLPKHYFNMIFADPPYFLTDDGITCRSGKEIKKEENPWDKPKTVQGKFAYNKKWIGLCKSLLTSDGTIFISGTFHNIYTIGVALEMNGFEIINNITWIKRNPPPNISCRALKHSTETILWAKVKGTKHKFNYSLMKTYNNNKQMTDIFVTNLIKPSERKEGRHPTQKPLDLLKMILDCATSEGDLVLDPFNGSGTTGIACVIKNRMYVGIDNIKDYLDITKRRYFKEKEKKQNEKKI